MTDAAVSRLKTELKRSLRQRVREAVDDVCDALVEDLGLPTTLPQVGASGNENDYECCRRFVEYIVRNMDTSSKFAEQMDCIILAYQSNAPVDVLNSVVTQNLWMRRTGPESGAEKTGLTDGREKVTAMKRSNTVIQVQSTGGNDAPKKSVVGTAANLSAALVENKEINAAQAKSAAISPRNSKSEHANNNKRRQNGFLVADMLKEARTMAVQKNLNGEEAPATTKIESKIAKAGKQAAKAKVAKQVPSTNDHTEYVIEGGGENKKVKTESADAQVGIETLRMKDEQSEALVDAALCQVERDLAAGDKTGDLDAAKRSFQAMLNAVVGHHAMDSHSMVLNESNSNEKARAVADPISNLCDAAQRSPDQTCIFKMRLRDTILIVDALLCKPPRGQSCSRDCKAIRAQMCNEFTPCINPTCRAWHEAETHSELCPDNQCEFKTRVVLRETMHLIEHKLQEVTEARNALELANTALLSPPRRSSKVTLSVGNAKVFNRIETLQNELQLLNAELAVVIDTRKQHWTTLNSIGIDSNADKVDEFPDFSSHYTCRIRRSKKARSSQQQLRR
ncbi:hypothetical protein PRNP1_008954 [Phytophthora ramorum]